SQQKEQIKELRETFNADIAPIKARIKALQSDRKQLEKNEASQQEIKAVLEKIADEEIALTLLLNKFKKNYLAVLTPEQRKKLQALKSK
ncbi:MAG: Spy/CpxP family protein refolding chaperone, partial [Candidatus Kapaibacterium sp.]